MVNPRPKTLDDVDNELEAAPVGTDNNGDLVHLIRKERLKEVAKKEYDKLRDVEMYPRYTLGSCYLTEVQRYNMAEWVKYFFNL